MLKQKVEGELLAVSRDVAACAPAEKCHCSPPHKKLMGTVLLT